MASAEDLDHAIWKTLQEWTTIAENSEAQAGVFASRLTSLCTSTGPEDLERFCWSLWQSFVRIAEDGPQDASRSFIDKLVELVQAIKKTEPLGDGHGQIVGFWAGECWKDLPLLGPTMRENWNTSPSQIFELPVQIKKNTFAARLTQLEVADFSLYGLWALREALEGEVPWSPAGPPEHTIPTAHVWIMHAGEALVRLHDNRGRVGKGGSLWKGQSGFCKERWLFWEQRFRGLSCNETLTANIRKLAHEAAERMAILSL